MADNNAVAFGALAIGGLFIYSAVTNKRVLSATQKLVQGQNPATAAANPQVITAGAAAGGSGTVTTGAVPSGGKGTLTHAALMALWISAGGSPSKANNAACHAIQESGGRPLVTSPNPDGGTNVGLWQLDTPGGKGAGYSIAQLQNPYTNARVAVKGSSNGTDWSAWATPGC